MNDFNARPFFLITIDTEGDDLWSHPRNITTKNARYLPRFQKLCESYGFNTTDMNFIIIHNKKFYSNV